MLVMTAALTLEKETEHGNFYGTLFVLEKRRLPIFAKKWVEVDRIKVGRSMGSQNYFVLYL